MSGSPVGIPIGVGTGKNSEILWSLQYGSVCSAEDIGTLEYKLGNVKAAEDGVLVEKGHCGVTNWGGVSTSVGC